MVVDLKRKINSKHTDDSTQSVFRKKPHIANMTDTLTSHFDI